MARNKTAAASDPVAKIYMRAAIRHLPEPPALSIEQLKDLGMCYVHAAVDEMFRPHWVFVTKKRRKVGGRRVVHITFKKESI